MSQNNEEIVEAIKGQIDYFDLLLYPYGCYIFELTNEPIVNSLVLSFDGYNNVLSSDCKLVKIVDIGVSEEDTNGITLISHTSIEADLYAKSLIGQSIIVNNRLVKVTYNNYLQYTSFLIDKIFIDFSISEKIINILNDLDEFGKRICTNFTVTYFYDLV